MSEIVKRFKESRLAKTVAIAACGAIALTSCVSTSKGESYTQSLQAEVGCPSGSILETDVKSPSNADTIRAFVTAACVSEDGSSSPVAYVELNEDAAVEGYGVIDDDFKRPEDTSGLDSYTLDITVPGRTPDKAKGFVNNPFSDNGTRTQGSRPTVGEVTCNYDLANNGNVEGSNGGPADNYDCTPYSEWTNISLVAVASGEGHWSDTFILTPEAFAASDVRVEVTS